MARVIALGFFDGVHLGHGALLAKTAAVAGKLGLEPAAMTFDRNPGKNGLLLSSVEDRTFLIRTLYGVGEVIVLPFDEALMHESWEDFLAQLQTDYDARYLICGYDYRFGYRGAGTPELLARWCRNHGVGCEIVPPEILDGTVISSSWLRQLAAAGEMEQAARFYGHPHLLSGTVTPGRRLGHTLGFPTANLEPEPDILLPKNGVYAVRAQVDGADCLGVCNVGSRPTVGGHCRRAETWLDGYAGDLYGKTLRLWFHAFLRPEQTFPDLEALRQQVLRDRDRARAWFAAHPGTLG